MGIERIAGLIVMIGLAACASTVWNKAGVSNEQAAADYAECNSLAQGANQRDSNIQADILASRGHDWSQSGTMSTHQATFAAESQQQSGDIIRSCMIAKGYAPGN